MVNDTLRRLIVSQLIVFAGSAPAPADETDHALAALRSDWVSHVREHRRADGSVEGADTFLYGRLAEIPIEGLSARQLLAFTEFLVGRQAIDEFIPYCQTVRARARSLSREASLDGAIAAEVRVMLAPSLTAESYDALFEELGAAAADQLLLQMAVARNDLILAALDHPGAAAAIRAGYGRRLLRQAEEQLAPDEIEVMAWRLAELGEAIDESPADGRLNMQRAHFELVRLADAVLPRAIVEERRTALLSSLRGERDARETSSPGRAHLEKEIAVLESPAMRGDIIGSAAADLSFVCSSGIDAAQLSDLRGAPVALDFWATWCGPCVASFPALSVLHDALAERGGRVLGVSAPEGRRPGERRGADLLSPSDELASVRAFAEQRGASWSFALIDGSVMDARFDVRGLPTLVLVDAAGRVRAVHHGMLDETDVPALLEALTR